MRNWIWVAFLIYCVPLTVLLMTLIRNSNCWIYFGAKIVASLSFLTVAAAAATGAQQMSRLLVLLPPLLCCFSGDVVLGLFHCTGKKVWFFGGLACFTLGHIAFVWVLSGVRPIHWMDFLLPAAGVLITYLLENLEHMEMGRMRPFACFYSFFVGMMFLQTILIFIQTMGAAAFTMMVGAGLFFISDVVILFLYFYKKKHVAVHVANLAFYYLGMFFIAVSLCL